ncbi:MAG: ankyrin repeat domain-containing protein [Rickettsiaceae bacterium]|nr:ankyrin repeat domain-containing protein [Rickettsiaceae bacterium]
MFRNKAKTKQDAVDKLSSLLTGADLSRDPAATQAEELYKQINDPNAKTNEGAPLLNSAVASRNIANVSFLIKKGEDPNAKSNYGITPLHLALIEQNFEVSKLLLKNGANPNLQGPQDKSPLESVLGYNTPDETKLMQVSLLLAYGADPLPLLKGQERITTDRNAGDTTKAMAQEINKYIDFYKKDAIGKICYKIIKGRKPLEQDLQKLRAFTEDVEADEWKKKLITNLQKRHKFKFSEIKKEQSAIFRMILGQLKKITEAFSFTNDAVTSYRSLTDLSKTRTSVSEYKRGSSDTSTLSEDSQGDSSYYGSQSDSQRFRSSSTVSTLTSESNHSQSSSKSDKQETSKPSFASMPKSGIEPKVRSHILNSGRTKSYAENNTNVQIKENYLGEKNLRNVTITVKSGPACVYLGLQDENGKQIQGRAFCLEFDGEGKFVSSEPDVKGKNFKIKDGSVFAAISGEEIRLPISPQYFKELGGKAQEQDKDTVVRRASKEIMNSLSGRSTTSVGSDTELETGSNVSSGSSVRPRGTPSRTGSTSSIWSNEL